MQRTITLALVPVLLCASAIAFAAGSQWAKLTGDQQIALRPLQEDWDRLTSLQRERLLNAARHYSAMTADQQLRFRQRLIKWSRLTLEQRDAARSAYKEYAHLTPGQQRALKERWIREHRIALEPAAENAPEPVEALP